MGSKTANHHTLRMWLQGISICFLFFTLVRADPVPDFQVVGSDGDHHHHHHHDHHHEEHHDHHEEKEPLLDSYGAPIAAPSSDVATSNFDSIDSYGAPIAEEIKEVKKCELVRSTTKRSAECFLEPECENKCEDKSKKFARQGKRKSVSPEPPSVTPSMRRCAKRRLKPNMSMNAIPSQSKNVKQTMSSNAPPYMRTNVRLSMTMSRNNHVR